MPSMRGLSRSHFPHSFIGKYGATIHDPRPLGRTSRPAWRGNKVVCLTLHKAPGQYPDC
jgi:hypothetical protein